MSREWSAMGLALTTDGEDDLEQPLSVAAVVKGLDSSGRIAYWVTTSEELTGVEALGMFDWAAEQARTGS